MGRGPIAVRVHLSGSPTSDPATADRPVGFDLTEAGTRKKLSVALVRDPADVPGVARLGVDPLTEEFTPERLAAILAAAGGRQLKGVLRDQSTIAGIGNAYSDEGLHAAKMSPFRGANKLDDAEVATLHAAIVGTLARRAGAGRGTGGRRAQGREEVEHARARAHRIAVPGVRRHRARGELRRLVAPVLSDLPDRWEAPRRPPPVEVAEVTPPARSDRRPDRP